MLILPIVRPAGAVVLAPVPFANLGTYEALRSQLLSAWSESGECIGELVADGSCWSLIQALVSLLPRRDANTAGFPFGDDYLWLETFLFEDLETLHQVDAIAQKQEPPEFPVPSSGDRYADLLADLSSKHSFADALTLLDRVDLDTLNKLLFRLQENAVDPAQRQEEELMADYDAWKGLNPGAHLPRAFPNANADHPLSD